MDMVKKYMDWVKDRVSERTSWDGAVIMPVSYTHLTLPTNREV